MSIYVYHNLAIFWPKSPNKKLARWMELFILGLSCLQNILAWTRPSPLKASLVYHYRKFEKCCHYKWFSPLSFDSHISVTQVYIPLRCLNSTTWVTVLLPTCLVTCQLTVTLEGQVVTLPTHGNTTTLVLGGLPQLVGGSFCYVVSVNVRSFYDNHGIYRFNLWHLLN